jgi:hypothetical protein
VGMTWPCILDWSYARPGAQAVLDYGAVGAMRYLGHDGRCIDPAERDELLGAGLGIGLIWETTARRPVDGRGAGLTDALAANDLADWLGAPERTPIFYAVDFQPTHDELVGPITEYFSGCLEAYGRPVAMYGCAAVVDHLYRTFPTMVCWQCAAWSYPGTAPGTPIYDGGWNLVLSPYAAMLQNIGYVLGDQADHNSLLTAPHFMWGLDYEDDVMTDEDWNRLTVIVGSLLDNRILNFATPNVIFEGPSGQFEVVVDGDGNRRRRGIGSTGESHMLRSTGLAADQVMRAGQAPTEVIYVAHLPPDQQAALDTYPWVS